MMLNTSRPGPMVMEEGGPARDMSRAAPLVADVATCLAGVGMLVGMCLAMSPRKFFWVDEVFTLVTVHGTTMGEMFASLKDTINAMPPTYFACLWPWSRAFGTSELALRMFSCLCMCVAWFFCWRLLRTFCSRPAAATASLAGMFVTKEILFNNMEARPYALYLAAYLAASLFFVRGWGGAAPSKKVAIGAFLAHATLVTTHYVGCLYSAALILSSLGGYAATRRPGLRSYAVGSLLGSAMFVIGIPFYLAQRDLGGEDNWIPRPTWGNLVHFVVITYPYAKLLVLIVVGFYASTLLILHRARPRASDGRPGRLGEVGPPGASGPLPVGMIVLCSVSFLLPIVLWAESRVGVRLFLDRYFLPSFVVWPCLLGLALERLAALSRREGPRAGGGAGSLVRAAPWACHGAVAVVTLAFGLVHYQRMSEADEIRSNKYIASVIRDGDLDFITGDGYLFLPVWNYAGRSTERMYQLPLESRGNRGITLRTKMKVFGAIERHFWPGLILTPGQLGTHRTRWLTFESERKDWVERGILPEGFRVVEKFGEGLVVIAK